MRNAYLERENINKIWINYTYSLVILKCKKIENEILSKNDKTGNEKEKKKKKTKLL